MPTEEEKKTATEKRWEVVSFLSRDENSRLLAGKKDCWQGDQEAATSSTVDYCKYSSRKHSMSYRQFHLQEWSCTETWVVSVHIQKYALDTNQRKRDFLETLHRLETMLPLSTDLNCMTPLKKSQSTAMLDTRLLIVSQSIVPPLR